MGHLEAKMTYASKEFEKGEKARSKFDTMTNDVDGYIQRNLVPLNQLESLMRKYTRVILKIESLRPIEKKSNDLRKLPTNAVKVENACSKNFVHLTPRKVNFKVSEDLLPLECKMPGEKKYDKFIAMTDTGIIAVGNTKEERTDIFKIFYTCDRGWQSRFLFPINRLITFIN